MKDARREIWRRNATMRHLRAIAALWLTWAIAGSACATEVCAKPPTSSLTVNVRDKGAQGNGTADDTAAIQSAVNQADGTGGTVFIPDGLYLVDAVRGIRLGREMTLRLSSGAVIKAMPNRSGSYSILQITNVSNVSIVGGTIAGERASHQGTAGEWGMGITLRAATNVVIEGITVRDTWGDGFYVSQLSQNVKLCSVTVDNNRRQGMSIISSDGLMIVNSTFKNTGGTNPQTGIDIEPNEQDSVRNVQILNSSFLNNKGGGIVVSVPYKHLTASVKDVTIKGNIISGNAAAGISIYNVSGSQVVNNILRDNVGAGIFLDTTSKDNSVIDNLIVGKEGVRDTGSNAVSRNTHDRR